MPWPSGAAVAGFSGTSPAVQSTPLVAIHAPGPVCRTLTPSRTAFPNNSVHLTPSAARRVRCIVVAIPVSSDECSGVPRHRCVQFR